MKFGHLLTITVATIGTIVLGGAAAFAGVGGGCGVPINVAEPMSIAAFVSGLAALYAVKKRRNSR